MSFKLDKFMQANAKAVLPMIKKKNLPEFEVHFIHLGLGGAYLNYIEFAPKDRFSDQAVYIDSKYVKGFDLPEYEEDDDKNNRLFRAFKKYEVEEDALSWDWNLALPRAALDYEYFHLIDLIHKQALDQGVIFAQQLKCSVGSRNYICRSQSSALSAIQQCLKEHFTTKILRNKIAKKIYATKAKQQWFVSVKNKNFKANPNSTLGLYLESHKKPSLKSKKKKSKKNTKKRRSKKRAQ